jgi:hypothetical protein
MKLSAAFVLVFILTQLSLRAQSTVPTWSSDIAQIIYKNCTSCHRSGEIAPFKLETYEQAQDVAYSIKRAVTKQEMPPWPPAKGHGNFIGNRSLSEEDIAKIAAWVDADMPAGDLASAPKPPSFPNGSQLGTPDMVLTMNQKWIVRGNNKDVYRFFVLPTNLLRDRHIKALEFRPGNAAVVHHVLYFLDTTGTARKKDAEDQLPGYSGFGDPGFESAASFLGWVPGAQTRFYPPTIGAKMHANSDLIIQVHYAPSTTEQTDQSHVNVFFHESDDVRQVQEFPMSPNNLIAGQKFIIPANKVPVFNTSFTLPFDISLIGIAPHMHLLGRDCRAFAVTPKGDTINLIKLDYWDFHWQGGYTYKNPVRIPRGSKLQYIATYDNTINNLNNPNNPPKEVRWGEGTTDEMLLCYFHWLPYQPGDESLDMETALPTSVAAESDGRGSGIMVFPNPVSDRLRIVIESSTDRSVFLELRDVRGTVVYQDKTQRLLQSGLSSVEVDVSRIAAGTYTLSVIGERATQLENVVIQR